MLQNRLNLGMIFGFLCIMQSSMLTGAGEENKKTKYSYESCKNFILDQPTYIQISAAVVAVGATYSLFTKMAWPLGMGTATGVITSAIIDYGINANKPIIKGYIDPYFSMAEQSDPLADDYKLGIVKGLAYGASWFGLSMLLLPHLATGPFGRAGLALGIAMTPYFGKKSKEEQAATAITAGATILALCCIKAIISGK